MIAIAIKFLTGAYHATPWGRDVNEGIPEWPPSAWRLLRAIISSWKITLQELTDKEILPIIQKLSSQHPKYFLPDANVTHTRHYLPTPKKPLIMDTSVVVGKHPLYMIWDNVKLTETETDLLQNILQNIHYFGRAESWSSITIHDKPPEANCIPLEDEKIVDGTELVRVLVPNKDMVFTDINSKSRTNNLKSITITTGELQDNNYIDPPGGRWIQYMRASDCFMSMPRGGTKTSLINDITVFRYAIIGNVRPSIKDTLRVGDIARSACMSQYGKQKNNSTSPVFSGKDANGNPLTNHQHAFYLPTYESQNREIDHLTIMAKKPFTKHELDVLFCLNRLYSYNMPSVNLIFLGCGTDADFSTVPILQKSKEWISATPVTLTRHIKYRGTGKNKHVVDSPKEQISRELELKYGEQYIPKKISFEVKSTLQDTNIRPYEFYRFRNHGSVNKSHTYAVSIEFEKPVIGPITLGYAAHFGLGMFVPRGD